MQQTLTIHTTTFTENEVFGTVCNDCGETSFDAATPTQCEHCDSDNLDSAEGCELPYDDDHTSTEEFTGTPVECANELLRRGLTETSDGRSFYNPDGSTISNYYTGEREEVSGHLSEIAA